MECMGSADHFDAIGAIRDPATGAAFVLDRQGFVRRFAKSLVFEAHTAGNVAQQTWLHPNAKPIVVK
jgi:hypothetical protein